MGMWRAGAVCAGWSRRHFLGGAHIDQLVAVTRSRGERGQPQLDVRILARQIADERTAGRDACRAARRLELHAREIREIHEQQLAAELPRHRQQDLEREQCLQRTEGARHGTQDPGFGAVADDAVRASRPATGSAGTRAMRAGS